MAISILTSRWTEWRNGANFGNDQAGADELGNKQSDGDQAELHTNWQRDHFVMMIKLICRIEGW